jgi:dTDP-4-amino-4,6-dideoxygalactose transaminase
MLMLDNLDMPIKTASLASQIPFSRPYFTGREMEFLARVCTSEEAASDGTYSKECVRLLESKLSSREILMTTSCTGALELAALLLNLGAGDQVIMPSFAFPSLANAVLLAGATPVFVDIRSDTCNIDENKVEMAITPRTKALCVVHYAGVACEMDALLELARRYSLYVVEDAAHAVGGSYKGRSLGTIGHLGTYSFHYTKNLQCGEGGALSINDPDFSNRANTIRDKGTNRRQFLLGQVDKYTWVDLGLSLQLSELCCAFLIPQLEAIDNVIAQRRELHERYTQGLTSLARRGCLRLPTIPHQIESNFHLFRIITADGQTRAALMKYLSDLSIQTTFHYVPLHSAPMVKNNRSVGELPVTTEVASSLLRLPLFVGLDVEQQDAVIEAIRRFFSC